MSPRLEGKIVLVTGSTTGIGRAIAERCVEEGARVVIHGLEDDLAFDTVAELGEANAAACALDLSEEGGPEALIEMTVAGYGQLDVLVNNAADVASGDLLGTDGPRFRQILEINTVAPYLLIQAALPHLEKTGGNVLNIGSVNAHCGEAALLPYSVSKGALMTMTRNLGDSLFRDHGVRVNQLNPGWVLTENEDRRKRSHGLAENWDETLPETLAPAGRILRPEEIAAHVAFWISHECGPISGEVVDLEQYPMIGRNPPKTGESLGYEDGA